MNLEHRYEHEGLTFWLPQSIEALRNIPPSSCAHYDTVNMTLFHVFGDMPSNWLSTALSRLENNLSQIRVLEGSEGCLVKAASFAITMRCPLKRCRRVPPRISKTWGGNRARVQQAEYALRYAISGDWLGVAKSFLGHDINGERLHISHKCCVPHTAEGSCCALSHTKFETKAMNHTRSRHQHGREPCDCSDPCLTNGRNIPIRDGTNKIIGWPSQFPPNPASEYRWDGMSSEWNRIAILRWKH